MEKELNSAKKKILKAQKEDEKDKEVNDKIEDKDTKKE